MLKLKELRLSGVGRFVEEQVINFDKLGNLVQVDGQNKNTGGSSGAGKSTVFHALDYLLGLNNIPNSVLKSRLTEESMSVQGEFDYDGKSLIVTRGKKLIVDLDGEVTKGSSKLSEEKLDSILGMPRDLFRNILHKRQKEGGFFLKMTPKEINEFLMNCLGLSAFKAKIEIIEKKAKELADKKLSIESALASGRSALKATQDAILSLGLAPVRDIHQSVILELKAKMEISSAEYAAVNKRIEEETKTLELVRPVLENKMYDTIKMGQYRAEVKRIEDAINVSLDSERQRQTKLRTEISDLKVARSNLSHAITLANDAKPQATKTALEIKKIREAICPTCEQTWLTDNAKTSEAMFMERLLKLKEVIAKGAKAEEQYRQVEERLNTLTAEASPRTPEELPSLNESLRNASQLVLNEQQAERDFTSAQHQSNKIKMDQFVEQQKSLKQKHAQEQQQAWGQMEVDRRACEAAVNKLRAYQEASTRYETTLNSLKAQETGHITKIDGLVASLDSVVKDLAIIEELKRALKSYLSCSFDDALETISENSTKLIRSIPNMANATIQLEGVRETQEGKVKEEVNAVIHMDGEENVDIRSLCGGERTATDLAIDLSVIDLIENRANKGINVFILDEPFDGLDTVCIEMALEVLKTSSLNKKLFIVDHNPEVKQMVESRLVVIRDGATSKITQS